MAGVFYRHYLDVVPMVAERLNRDGRTARTGNPERRGTVANILRREFAAS
jgi:hypothetical protein